MLSRDVRRKLSHSGLQGRRVGRGRIGSGVSAYPTLVTHGHQTALEMGDMCDEAGPVKIAPLLPRYVRERREKMREMYSFCAQVRARARVDACVCEHARTCV